VAITARKAQVARFVRGTVTVQRRRCGKPTCHCTDGTTLHETTVLSYSTGGRSRVVMLPSDQVDVVRAAVERYRAAQRALEDQANAGLAGVVATWGGRRSKA
jgi:hypothetical protein